MDQHIVLCGLGRTGWRVLDYLRAAGLPVVVIDSQCRPDDPRLAGVTFVPGDMRQRDVLARADIDRARGVLVLTNDDLVNVATAMTVRSLNRSVRIVLRLFNQNLLGRLGKTVENIFALSTSLLTAPMLAVTALTGQGLGSFRVEGRTDGPSPKATSTPRQIVQVAVEADHPGVGRSVGSLAPSRDVLVLAHRRPGDYLRLLGEVDPATPTQAGDEVVLCGPPRDLAAVLPDAGDATRATWRGWLGRQARAVFGSLPEIDPALRYVFYVLLAIVALGTVVLRYGAENTTWTKGLVRTLTALTTTNSTIDLQAQDPLPITVFLTFLKITGTAFVAVLTAILTNYFLRARLGQILDVRRVPEAGHVVVCGLSPVGFRVVEELLQAEAKPVVVELDEANRFVATLRRQGVPVVGGDATVPEVLRQANVRTAKAVVVATNHDLINLEVALLVRDANEQQRVVVMQSDPNLANLLREAANIRQAVSIHALAAPAFLAALFGDRILAVFLIRDRILAVVDLVAQGADDVLLDQSVRAIAVDYHLAPVAVIPAGGEATTTSHRFASGDRVVGIIALSDLERLLKREAPPREYAVELDAMPLPARGWVVGQLRLLFQCSNEEAEAKLASLPLRLAENLTRGQAEDLAARFQRERVAVRLVGPAVPVTAGEVE